MQFGNKRNLSLAPVKTQQLQGSDEEITTSQRLGRKSINFKSIREFFDQMSKQPKKNLDGLALEILIRDLVNDLNAQLMRKVDVQQKNINFLKTKQSQDQTRLEEAQQRIKLLIAKFDMKDKLDQDQNVRKNQFHNLEKEF